MATGFGLRFSHTLHGGKPVTRRYVCLAAYATALYRGDVVRLAATPAGDSKGEVPAIERAATGNVILGVIDSFEPDGSIPFTGNYRAASTLRYCNVIVDPEAVYQIQEDAVGGAVTAAQVAEYLNADIIVANGSTATGVSGTMLDSNTVAATGEDLKIVGVPANGGDNYAGVSGGAVLEVMILSPAIKATDSNS